MVMSKQPPPETARAETAALIARVHLGDQEAARELVAQVRKIVLRIARAHPLRRMAEEDIVQEVFMKMFARLRQYRGDAPFEHWVSRIAATTCLDQLRAQRHRPELRWADLPESEALMVEATHRDSHTLLPGRELATRELLHRLLSRLSPEDRKVIVWFELEEKTIAEIEALTGWNFNFVKMRLFRARRKLKRFLTGLSGYDGAGMVRAPAPRRSLRFNPRRDQPELPRLAA
jgi:RNA polymerase sigma factor (sigma-70 family)